MKIFLFFLFWLTLIPPPSDMADDRITWTLRQKPQTIRVLEAKGPAKSEAILYMPGDGGWIGTAVDMARVMSALGYNVYGFDIKTYLTDFTGKTTLTEQEMAADLRDLGAWVHQKSGLPVIFAGWSQGANMALLGGVASSSDSFCRGVLAIGMGDRAVLGWRFIDNLTYFTRSDPNEPVFLALSHIAKLAPLPLVIVAPKHDEFVPTAITYKLYNAAAEPKRLLVVDALNHSYSGRLDKFSEAVDQGLTFIHNSARGRPPS